MSVDERKRPRSGVKRRVVFQAWCTEYACNWSGPERDAKWYAEADHAGHRTDKHPSTRAGGIERA